MKKSIYLVQVNFKNHNDAEVKEFKAESEGMHEVRFIGYTKTDLVSFEDAKVYQTLTQAEKVAHSLNIGEIADYGNILEACKEVKATVRTFTIQA